MISPSPAVPNWRALCSDEFEWALKVPPCLLHDRRTWSCAGVVGKATGGRQQSSTGTVVFRSAGRYTYRRRGAHGGGFSFSGVEPCGGIRPDGGDLRPCEQEAFGARFGHGGDHDGVSRFAGAPVTRPVGLAADVHGRWPRFGLKH